MDIGEICFLKEYETSGTDIAHVHVLHGVSGTEVAPLVLLLTLA